MERQPEMGTYPGDPVSLSGELHSSCQDLETLIKGCPNMEQFELITPNFHSVFHRALGMCVREQNFYAWYVFFLLLVFYDGIFFFFP